MLGLTTIVKGIMTFILITFFSVAKFDNANISHTKIEPNPKLSHKEQQFINHLLPYIRQANSKIKLQRTKLEVLYATWQKNKSLTATQTAWLKGLAVQYDIKQDDIHDLKFWNSLKARVNTIPVALVLAQAINESGWGRSRFAELGHNYFGVWCYHRGCGFVPKRRPKGATYEVRRYASTQASIDDYFHAINTVTFYRHFRHQREQLQEQHKQLTGLILLHSLAHYSQRGAGYESSLKQTINDFDLTQYEV